MYAFSCTMLFGAVHRIFGGGQAHFEPHPTASAQKTSFLRHTRAIRYWFHDSRPGRPAQSYSGMAG